MSQPQTEGQLGRRDEFLLHLYDNLWLSINRVESGLWQFLAFYGLVAGLMIGAVQGVISRLVATAFSLGIAFWGMNIAINSAKWFSRNLLFSINIEKEFLREDDVGRIIPASYHEPRTRVLNILNKIHLSAFAAAAALSLYFGWGDRWYCLVFISAIGAALTIVHWVRAKRDLGDFVEGTSLRHHSTETVDRRGH